MCVNFNLHLNNLFGIGLLCSILEELASFGNNKEFDVYLIISFFCFVLRFKAIVILILFLIEKKSCCREAHRMCKIFFTI